MYSSCQKVETRPSCNPQTKARRNTSINHPTSMFQLFQVYRSFGKRISRSRACLSRRNRRRGVSSRDAAAAVESWAGVLESVPVPKASDGLPKVCRQIKKHINQHMCVYVTVDTYVGIHIYVYIQKYTQIQIHTYVGIHMYMYV